MQRNIFVVYFIFILISSLFYLIHSLSVTNLCSGTSTCNCTLTDNINLDIICSSTLNLTDLPLLDDNTLQIGVTQLRISSLINGTHGPLITLPKNICLSYPNIAILDLSFNAITDLLNTSELACLGSNLLQVDFSNNFINNVDENFFQANNKLQSINLAMNNLTTMPITSEETFVNFPSTIRLMNFSYNQITNVDLWPLFVKTGNLMTIDMSNNLIKNFTNQIPIYVKQFTETPDPRSFYLNNNQIERISDLLLEQYGACSTISSLSTAYFIVGISNMLLTDNSLICDCESYYLLTFINDGLTDFPQINNGSALLTQALCTLPSSMTGQKYIFANFTQTNLCDNYTLPNIDDRFCSVYTNQTNSTLAPPTYWPTTTTILTTIPNGNETITTTSDSEGGNGGSNNGGNNSDSASTSPAWYIILGIVLGLVLILVLIVIGIFLCKDRLLPEKFRSRLRKNNNLNNSYDPIIRRSELSSPTNLPLNGIRPHRSSMSTSTCGIDDQDNKMLQLNNTSPNDHNSWDDEIHPEQETQTCFQINRSKPSNEPSRSIGNRQQIQNNNTPNRSHHKRKLSISNSTNVATNTANIVKGIPISSLASKISTNSSNINDTSTSELSITSIPITPSKRAKLLPPVKSGIYMDSPNQNLLNTSASALITNQRQRRRSSLFLQKQQQQNEIALPIIRPQSMTTRKTNFNQNDSSNEQTPSVPTVEELTKKSSKPVRALPLLNITVVPAWIDDNDNDDQT